MTNGMLNVNYLLEKAKCMLSEYKKVLPVLFVETSKGIYVIGLEVDFDKVDKRVIMADIGSKFSGTKEKIEYICMLSAANILKMRDNKNVENAEKCEAIIIATLDVINNKRGVVIQKFERSNDEIVFKDIHEDTDVKGKFLLDAFMQGYYQTNIILN